MIDQTNWKRAYAVTRAVLKGMTLREAGKKYGICPGRVGQLFHRVMREVDMEPTRDIGTPWEFGEYAWDHEWKGNTITVWEAHQRGDDLLLFLDILEHNKALEQKRQKEVLDRA